MREQLEELVAVLERGLRVAWCRLIETRGSTPQKAGAAMLVFPDGTQHGTLGGGCVEAEVKRRALAALASGQAEVARFVLDSDYGWDDGLICGGRMQVLIQPVDALASEVGAYFSRLASVVKQGIAATEAVAFAAHDEAKPAQGEGAGNSPAPLPCLSLWNANGELLAAFPAASLAENGQREAVQQRLRPHSQRASPYGERGFSFLPLAERCPLFVIGGGHVGQAVANLASQLDFRVTVVDDRQEFANPKRMPTAERCVVRPLGEALPQLEITPDAFCLIVTRGHSHDQEALYHLASRGCRYLGLIGSRRKIRLIFENLLAAGISASHLARVYAPVGLDIGSQTVPEIAVSICAELVAVRNRETIPARPLPNTVLGEILAVERPG